MIGITAPIASYQWFGMNPISAGVFGVPVGMITHHRREPAHAPPSREVQELVEHVRYPNLAATSIRGALDAASTFDKARATRGLFLLMQTELLLVVIAKALAELAGMFLLGRGLLYVLAGRNRENNIFYQVISIVTNPVIRAARWVTPHDHRPPHPGRGPGAVAVDLARARVLGAARDVRFGPVRLNRPRRASPH